MWERECISAPTVASEFCDGFLFVGIGSELRVYDVETSYECLITLSCLRPGTLIHGIRFLDRCKHSDLSYSFGCERSTIVSVFGQKQVVSFLWDRSSTSSLGSFSECWCPEESKDWIWDIMLGNVTEGDALQVIQISAHNVLEIWDFSTQKCIRRIASPSNSILYSARLYYSIERGLVVACGTVFNQVLVWAPLKDAENLLVRLEGHEGVIFGVTWNEAGDTIISTSDDRSARVWKNIWEAKTCVVLYGHTARVWRSVWVGHVEWSHSEAGQVPYKVPLLLTCSEDMTCRLWNADTSHCVGIYHGHTGKNVWSICVDPLRKLAVSTGADGAVKLWSILSILDRFQGGIKSKVAFPGELEQLHPQAIGDYVQVLEILDASRVLVATRKGFLAVLHLPSLQWEIIHFREGSTFRFMCTSPETSSFPNHAILGEDAGYLTLLSTNERNEEGIRVYAHKRITSLFWPHGDQLFSGGYESNAGFCCKWWTVDRSSTPAQFKLRATLSAEAEIIRSLVISPHLPNRIVAGDAKGSVFFYEVLEDQIDQEQVESIKPTSSFLRIHGKERVSSLLVTENKEILSVGRDGRLCTFRWDDRCELASTGKIRKRVDNAEQILSISSHDEEQLYVVGFYGGKLVVEGLDLGAQFLSIECGGLHRPHDFSFLSDPVGQKDPSFYICTFLQRKFIHVHQSSSLIQQTESSAPVQRTLIPTLHGLQVNTLHFLEDGIFLSGSEDTSMKLAEVQPFGHFAVSQTLRGQASSIRCTAISKCDGEEHSLLFSGGGEYCLVAWNLSVSQRHCALAKKFIKRKQADCRVMSLAVYAINTETFVHQSLHLVFMGLSNSEVEILGYNPLSREFTVLGSLSGHNGPILSLQHIHHGTNHFLLSSSTDGRILIWNVTSFVEFYQKEEKHKDNDESYEAPDEMMKPVLALQLVHQSGVNSFSVTLLEHTDQCDQYLIISGGDDQSISCTVIQIDHTAEVQCLVGYNLPCAHRASVTCVKPFGNLLFSTGPDQRLSVWDIISLKNTNGITVSLQHKTTYFGEIADASCLDIQPITKGQLRIIIGGMGVQSLLLDTETGQIF